MNKPHEQLQEKEEEIVHQRQLLGKKGRRSAEADAGPDGDLLRYAKTALNKP
jgi:hypothetical protein